MKSKRKRELDKKKELGYKIFDEDKQIKPRI